MTLPLLACGLTGLQSDYKLEGVQDEELQTYLSDIIDNQLQGVEEEDKAEDKIRQEAYIENTLRATIQKALHAKGYYDSTVEFKNNEKQFSGTFNIVTGDIYKIEKVEVTPKEFLSIPLEIKQGDDLDALKVLQSQSNLLSEGRKDKCYYSFNVTHEVKLNEDTKKAEILFKLNAGKEANFAETKFVGMTSVEESYLRKLIPWQKGDCFSQDQIEKFKTTILESGLFSRIEALLPAEPNTDGTVDITFEMKERAHRTISAGVNYYTDEGPGLELEWQHRNFFGQAENLKLGLTVSQLEQTLKADLTKPNFLRKDQELSLNTSVQNEDNDAYKEVAIEGGASIARKITKNLKASTGVKFTLSEVEDNSFNDTETYGLVSFPQTINFDNRDDSLNPHKGWIASGAIAPYVDAFGKSDPFIKTKFGAATYFDLDGTPDKNAKGTDYDWIFALRGTVGSIWGADLESIPASERFYAGGGGSVRGFGFQEVGPFIGDDPTGGRSLIEGSAELRFKVTQEIGSVFFVDVGNVSEDTMPDLSDLAMGVGAGLRYYTGFGPVRFDIATPISGDDNTDQNYQFYISIGQAF